MASPEEKYLSTLQELDSLISCAIELSVSIAKLEGDSRKQLASIIFAKIILCALSIRKLLPNSATIPGPEVRGAKIKRDMFCDVSSTASLCRNLIEASNRLYYIGVEQLSSAEARMRLTISEYHAVSGQISIFKYLLEPGPALDELESERSELKKRLEEDSEFQKLENKVKKDIFGGRMGEHLSQAQIAERRGRNIAAFRADYKYLSSHIHSDSLSFGIIHLMHVILDSWSLFRIAEWGCRKKNHFPSGDTFGSGYVKPSQSRRRGALWSGPRLQQASLWHLSRGGSEAP